MKKHKVKTLLKISRKNAKKDIQADLTKALQEVVGKFGKTSKKLDKTIKRSAIKLAKELSKELNLQPETDAKETAAAGTEAKAVRAPQKAAAPKTPKSAKKETSAES